MMLPGVFEFHWDLGHFIFLGAFYGVLTLMGVMLTVGGRRALRLLRAGHVDHARWHEEFEELPPAARACRHALSGQYPGRHCERGFDCGGCEEHPVIAKWQSKAPVDGTDAPVIKECVHPGRLHHRGHTWVEKAGDGTARIGLDGFARRLIGPWDSVEVPEVGTRVEVNGTAWTMVKGGARLRILSPVTGVIVATGKGETADYLTVKLDEPGTLDHLLDHTEAPVWLACELERLRSLPDCAPFADAVKRGGSEPQASCPDDGRRLAWRLLLLTEP